MSSDPKPVGGQWHKAARGELSPPKGASEETLVPQLFTASVPDPRTVRAAQHWHGPPRIGWLALQKQRICGTEDTMASERQLSLVS